MIAAAASGATVPAAAYAGSEPPDGGADFFPPRPSSMPIEVDGGWICSGGSGFGAMARDSVRTRRGLPTGSAGSRARDAARR